MAGDVGLSLPLPYGECRYNDVDFGISRRTKSFNVRAIYDSSGRNVIYTVNTLTIEFVVVVGDDDEEWDLNERMADYRRKLMVNGAEFIYKDIGAGSDLSINTDDGITDLVWGPKPISFNFTLTGDQAARCTWQVEFAIPLCDNLNDDGVIESNSTIAWEIGTDGYTRRTISGFARIAQTKVDAYSKEVSDSADRLREAFYPNLLPGFRRIPGRFSLDESRCKLSWSVTDEEMPVNIPPPGVVDVRATQTTRSLAKLCTTRTTTWENTLTATYTLHKDTPRSRVWEYFTDLMDARIGRSKDANANGGAGQVPGSTESSYPIIRSLSCTEQIYARETATLSVTWTFLSSLSDMIYMSGLFSPLDSDWEAWAFSLRASEFGDSDSWSARGNAGLAYDPASEMLIDICQPVTPVASDSGKESDNHEESAEIKNDYPDPENSWLTFYNSTSQEVDDDLFVTKRLPGGDPTSEATETSPGDSGGTSPGDGLTNSLTTGDDETSWQDDTASNVSDPFEGSEQPKDPIGYDDNGETDDGQGSSDPSQSFGTTGGGAFDVVGDFYSDSESNNVTPIVRNSPEKYVVMKGNAVRAGYSIEAPKLLAYQGFKVVPANDSDTGQVFESYIYEFWLGVPIVVARWELRYLVLGDPSDGEGWSPADDPNSQITGGPGGNIPMN